LRFHSRFDLSLDATAQSASATKRQTAVSRPPGQRSSLIAPTPRRFVKPRVIGAPIV
jgi:hypothetical protein